ncbi:MAG: peptidoglycan DD-metalloendopeptidase family protein [Acetobacteraceae bacterium]|nr:peptidoglycan DD-metalloendopeptidase family protein [Acetobacteraceae bacterium]
MKQAARQLALVCLLLLGAAAPAAVDVQQAEAARNAAQKAQDAARARAAAAAEDERRLATARIAAAAKLRQLDADLAAAANRVAEFWHRQQEAQIDLQEQGQAISTVLPVIGRLARYPAETMLVLPQTPEDSVRGLLILNAITHDVGTDLAKLQREQDRLATLGSDLAAAQTDLTARQAAQTQDAAALDAQIVIARQTRTAAEGEANAWARKAADAAAHAENVRQAIAKLEQMQRSEAKSEPARARAEAVASKASGISGISGGLAVPVAGGIAHHFGDEVDGAASTAIVYQAPSSARVEAPCTARVVFAGQFRSFGLLTILDCGGGYHVVLSGFDRLDVQLGQTLRQGEPVGVMPGWNPLGIGRKPLLNFELRHDGQPIDPAPMLRATG